MIQELLGGAGFIGGERKIPISGNILEGTSSPCLSPSPSSSTITNTTAVTVAASATNNSTSSTSENLRCPRCDSSNTKFCYYNNYNLTQPRHFCKTCRRYWTKGGALRNVPIGGGCRKNKSTSVSAVVGKSSSTNKLKSVVSEVGRSAFGNGFAHEFSSSPNLWSPPENSHILALLRGTHYPSPSALSNTLNFKEEGSMSMLGTNIMTEVAMANGAVNARTLGLEPLSQGPSLGLCSPLWKASQKQVQNHQQNGSTVCEAQNSGLQELYQRLRSSTSSNYYMDNSSVILSNVASSSTSASNILESAPVAGGELGFWNPAFSWSDLPTTNGAYP